MLRQLGDETAYKMPTYSRHLDSSIMQVITIPSQLPHRYMRHAAVDRSSIAGHRHAVQELGKSLTSDSRLLAVVILDVFLDQQEQVCFSL